MFAGNLLSFLLGFVLFRTQILRENMEDKHLFLQTYLNGEYELQTLTHGMSFRTYDRVISNKQSFVLMNVPMDKPLEDGQSGIDGVIKPFLKVQKYLKDLNIKVPEIFNVDEVSGKVLLEDFGHETLYDIFSKTPVDIFLYKKAIDDLVTIYNAPPIKETELFCEAHATIRGDFFLDDYLPAITGQESTAEQYADLHDILKEIYQVVVNVKWGTVLWDYHSPNLMPVEGSVGVLDFQDAKVGPLSYDLASLLYDARYPFPKKERELLFNYFIECVYIEDIQSFKDSFEMASLLRNIGILGRFARVAYRDKKPEFLPKIAVLWPYVEEALQNPKAQKLKQFLDANMLEEKLLAI